MADNENAEANAKSGSPMMTGIKIAVFVAVVLGLECAMALMFLPSAGDVSAMADAKYGPTPETTDPVADLDPAATDEPTVEVDLKEYSVTAYQPLSNTTLRIDFHLYGAVAESKTEKFNTLFTGNENRLKEQVIITIRGSEITDLTDAGLGLVKRKLLDKVNRTIGEPLVNSIIISEFSFVEQ
ncbi:MAG: hypothetical protein KDA41_22370 [Planctomycetales bacterium]|nr:hypothetical protein [Planctomycetales bacterium]